MLEEILVMLSSASNLEYISLFDAKFDIDIISYLIKYKSLKSLSLFEFYALGFQCQTSSSETRIFDSLVNLRELKLIKRMVSRKESNNIFDNYEKPVRKIIHDIDRHCSICSEEQQLHK